MLRPQKVVRPSEQLCAPSVFNRGPGATGRSYDNYPTTLASIRERLLTLPATTVVRTGHGDSTTIGAERETLAKVSQ